jgi:hypothetical protein
MRYQQFASHSRSTVITVLDTLKQGLLPLQRHLGNWSGSPAVSMRSELFVALEKLGQFPLLIVYVVPV